MLPEILEPDATGSVAATYARIKQVQATSVVNLIWRHLATIEGGLAWAWPAAELALPAIRAATGPALHAAHEAVAHGHLADGLALTLPTDVAPDAIHDVLSVYERGNCFNMLAMTALTAMRAGAAPSLTGAPEPTTTPSRPVPPMPRYDGLAASERRLIDQLADAGPARASGVRPSLWVHLALWPAVLHDVAALAVPILASPAFAAAHAALRDQAVALLGLPPLPPEAADPAPIDRAIGRFRQRIPEMLLIGRVLMLASPH